MRLAEEDGQVGGTLSGHELLLFVDALREASEASHQSRVTDRLFGRRAELNALCARIGALLPVAHPDPDVNSGRFAEPIDLVFTAAEVRLIREAMRVTVDAIDDWEFSSRVSGDKDDMRQMLAQLDDLVRRHLEPADKRK